MELKIYDKANSLRLTASPNTSSSVTEEIGGECSVSASFTHTAYVPLDVDDYIDLEGVRFKIKSRYRPKQKNTQTYEYSVKFYAPIHDAEDTLMLFQEGGTTSEFSYDGGPREHLQLWIDNMNRRAGGNLWSIGTVITADNKTIDYRNVKCWDAAFGSNGIASTFDTEMWADGYVINLCKAERGEVVELGYLQGLTNLAQEDNGEVKFFTRLFPLGSTKNIDASKYGYSRLQLPDRSLYVDKNVDLYGVKEETEETAFSEIFPKYIGTISSVRTEEKTSEEGRKYTVYYFKDNGMNWNPKDYEIPDLDYMLKFQTGELAGRGTDGSFQAAWHEDTREWEIINVYPDDTTQIPGGAIIPQPGDKYIPWNFAMPQEYITAAEQAYKQAVDDFLNTYSFDPNKYTGTTDRNYIEKNNTPLRIGWNVRLLSEQYFGTTGGYKDTRVTKVQRKLNDLCQATITCSDEVGTGWKSSVDNSLNSLRYEVARQAEQTMIDIIKTSDNKTPSDYNVLSALKAIGMFLRKDKPDSTNFLMRLLGGLISDNIESQDFSSGPFGSGFVVKRDPKTGKSYIEADEIYIRLKAYFDTMEVKHLSHVGGRVVLSPASMECTRVEVISTDMDALYDYNGDPLYDAESSRLYALKTGTRSVSVYRCYFKQSDDTKEIVNEFAVDDLAQCREFNVKENVSQNVYNQYYWRRVVAVGKDYIDLSADDCDAGSLEPKAGDTIVTVGNKTNEARQHVVFLSSYDDDAPCIKLYSGINDYSMLNKEVTVISPNADKNVFTGKVVIKPGSSGFNNFEDGPDFDAINADIEEANKNAQQAINTAENADRAVGDLNDYVDGAFADGIISESEAKAIEKYINTVNNTKQEVDATYSKLYNNAYLTGTAKDGLSKSKTSFDTATSNLISSINTAISDGKTTQKEKEDVDSKFNLFNTAYANFATAIETANKAIQDEIKKQASDEAKENALTEINKVSEEYKEDIAEKLGYGNYKELEAFASRGETIISGGSINTKLINATLIVTSALIANAIKSKELNVNDNFIVKTDGSVDLEGIIRSKGINTELVLSDGYMRIMYNNNEVLRLSVNESTGLPELNMSYQGKTLYATPSVLSFGMGGGQFLRLDPAEIGSGVIMKDSENRLYLATQTYQYITVYLRVSPEGAGKTSPFNGGSIRLIGSSETISAIANEGYEFERWSDGGAQTHTVSWTDGSSITAYFTKKEVIQYKLTVAAMAGGTVSPSGINYYNAGTKVQITAKPNAGYIFNGWLPTTYGSSETIEVIMDAEKGFIASFKKIEENFGEELLPSWSNNSYWDNNSDAKVTVSTSDVTIGSASNNLSSPTGFVIFGVGYLQNKLKSGKKYRLTFECYPLSTTDGANAIISSVGKLNKSQNNADSDISDNVIYGEKAYSGKWNTFTLDMTMKSTSDAEHGVLFYGINGSIEVRNISLKELL
jgi:hypothetical protein|nr:MAG TPA: Minor structural protein putative tail fiber [Caudoviricetes sp.]